MTASAAIFNKHKGAQVGTALLKASHILRREEAFCSKSRSRQAYKKHVVTGLMGLQALARLLDGHNRVGDQRHAHAQLPNHQRRALKLNHLGTQATKQLARLKTQQHSSSLNARPQPSTDNGASIVCMMQNFSRHPDTYFTRGHHARQAVRKSNNSLATPASA